MSLGAAQGPCHTKITCLGKLWHDLKNWWEQELQGVPQAGLQQGQSWTPQMLVSTLLLCLLLCLLLLFPAGRSSKWEEEMTM